MKKILASVFCVLFLLQESTAGMRMPVLAAEPSGLYGNYICLMDAESGRVLYEKNGNVSVPMASTTKIMTCMMVLEHTSPKDIVTVSHYASTMPDVQLNIREGEQYYVEDLLHSLMLESHNDVAVALAEYVGGSVEGFAELMNEKAAELGLSGTHFVTPNGLDAEGHHTTAVELCKIAAWAVQKPEFCEIVQEKSWSFSEVNGKRNFTVSNKDRFLDIYDGALGVKTGFTGKAGYCFVGAAKQEDTTLISAVLACGWPPNKNYKWADTTKLMDYGFGCFTREIVSERAGSLAPCPVKNGLSGQVALRQEGKLETLLAEDERVMILYRYPEELTAPVEAGSVIGSVDYYAGGEYLGSLPVVTADAVAPIGFMDYLRRISCRFLSLLE